MSISMALFSSPISSSLQNRYSRLRSLLHFRILMLSPRSHSLFSQPSVSLSSSSLELPLTMEHHPRFTMKILKPVDVVVDETPVKSPAESSSASENGDVAGEATDSSTTTVIKFQDARWVNGTWDLKQFSKDGKTGWDSVIVAEAKRRKFLEDNPETTTNNEPVLFDTSVIPWWAWMKRYHLPEAELLNGLVDQMGNFFCKTLLFVARRNFEPS